MEQSEQAGRHPSIVATLPLLVLVIILFGLVVGYGWLRLLATAMDPLAAGFVAALITVIAVLLGRTVGGIFLLGRRAPGFWPKMLLLYPVLFAISALGTINAAFYNFEGGSVLEQVIDDATRQMTALDAVTRSTLRDPISEKRAATVDRLLTQLESEITHQDNCGVGPVAQGIIAKIQEQIPQFTTLSQRSVGRVCDIAALRELAATYRDNAHRMLDADPEARDRNQLRADILEPLTTARGGLNRAKALLSAGGGFGANYGQAQTALEQAATVYADAREKLANARPAAAAGLPAAVDTTRSRNLGSIFAMPATLAARIGYGTTWGFFAIAVLLDLFLVFLFLETLRGVAPLAPAPRRVPISDPQFLWVNQGA